MELIAGDIGGTKSWLVWVALPARNAGKERAVVRDERVYASADFQSADALVGQFIADAGMSSRPDRLLLALPGPLRQQRVHLTNLDWSLDAAAMERALGIASVHFINDFQAAAAGVATLTPDDVVSLNPVAPEAGGVRAITGAGTGLGLAYMLADGAGRYRHFASEGGHVDFAPANAVQTRLLEHLRALHGHVSWERAVSGSALPELYRFCCREAGAAAPAAAVEGAELAARAESGDAAARAALELFIDLYGAWIGNVALMYQPRGGLYIAGGVAHHLQSRMTAPRFMEAALDKGRMRGVVERTPIHLVTCSRLGLQGALASALPAGLRIESGHRLQTA